VSSPRAFLALQERESIRARNKIRGARPDHPEGVLGTAVPGMLAVGEASLSKFMRACLMPGRSIYAANGGAAGPVHLPGITQPRAARGRAKRFLRTVVVKPVPRFEINTTASGLRLKRE